MTSPTAALAVGELRCEYLRDPLAIDAPAPRLSWQVETTRRGGGQVAYHVVVATTAARLARRDGDLWDSGEVASSETLHVVYGGARLRSHQDAHWAVRVRDRDGVWSEWSPPARWRAGVLAPDGWAARWIASPATLTAPRPEAGRPATMLRHEFDITTVPDRAIALVSALGVYDLSVNGERVSDRVLAPEWTDYHRRIQYQAIDLAPFLAPGRNAIGALLADGWYAGRLAHVLLGADDPTRGYYGDRTALLLQLELEWEDGRRQRVVTDKTWLTTADVPLTQACLMDGEHWDARRELPGWDRVGYDARHWTPALLAEPPTGALVAQPNEPIRVTHTITPRAQSEPRPGVYVLDLGQNIAGRIRLRGRGRPGVPVVVRHGEMLEHDGTVYRANLRHDRGGGHGAAATDVYTPADDGEFTWEPRFTYHGFRYVEIEGLAAAPGLTDIDGLVTHSDVAFGSRLTTSHPLLNRLIENASWTLRGNLHGLPTDCPQRDERLGFLGDMLAFGQSACFTADMAAFFDKWLADIRDAQCDDGRFPDFAPHCWEPEVRFAGTPGWADGGAIIPLIAYTNYADVRLVEASFEPARRWVDSVVAANPDLLWRQARGMDFGDWLNAESFERGEDWPNPGAAEIPKEVFATGFLIRSARAVARMARILAKDAEAERYAVIADAAARAFTAEYVGADGTVLGDTQAGYALALHLDLVPEVLRPRAVDRLVDRIADYDGHLSTGFHTTPMLMSELMRAGREQLAYDLLLARTLPSWGFMIDNGATTVWERWDGWVRGRGFQRPVMNSFSHYAFGSILEWVWNHVAGVQPIDPGWSRAALRPRPGGGITSARGEFASPRGRLVSDWRREGTELTWDVVIPAGMTAELRIPAPSVDAISEGGLPLGEVEGLTVISTGADATIVDAESGRYRFRVRGVPRRRG